MSPRSNSLKCSTSLTAASIENLWHHPHNHFEPHSQQLRPVQGHWWQLSDGDMDGRRARYQRSTDPVEPSPLGDIHRQAGQQRHGLFVRLPTRCRCYRHDCANQSRVWNACNHTFCRKHRQWCQRFKYLEWGQRSSLSIKYILARSKLTCLEKRGVFDIRREFHSYKIATVE